ncbi:MAG TPA: hypothetical protein VM262_12295 [Acidimicrobiales bacterium]|nr:hypothetical protein [Acidimicrobiales bacterium]
MRLRRGSRNTSDVRVSDAARLAAWDGQWGTEGPRAVIRAERAGDVAAAEVPKVA